LDKYISIFFPLEDTFEFYLSHNELFKPVWFAEGSRGGEALLDGLCICWRRDNKSGLSFTNSPIRLLTTSSVKGDSIVCRHSITILVNYIHTTLNPKIQEKNDAG